MGDFRFSLRHCSNPGNPTVPTKDDVEEFEPFIYYESSEQSYFLGFKLPYPTSPNTKDFFQVVKLTAPPLGGRLSGEPFDK